LWSNSNGRALAASATRIQVFPMALLRAGPWMERQPAG
jgi:hypothetical protein